MLSTDLDLLAAEFRRGVPQMTGPGDAYTVLFGFDVLPEEQFVIECRSACQLDGIARLLEFCARAERAAAEGGTHA